MEKKIKIGFILIVVLSISFIGLYYYVISKNVPPNYEEYGFYKGQKSYQLTLPETSGTNYYFSSSIGSDENDGLTPSTPKKTLQDFGINMSLNPGDKILLRCGDKFSSIRISTSGSLDENIYLSSYNDGNNEGSLLKPVVLGESTFGILVNGSYISILDVEIRNFNRGILLTPISSNNNISYNYITRNVVGIYANHSNSLCLSYNLITSQEDGTVWGMEQYSAIGIIIEGDNSMISKNVFLNNISPSRTTLIVGSAILLKGSHNIFKENYAKGNARFAEIGFETTDSSITITNNSFHRNVLVNNQDGMFFFQYGNTNNTQFQENLLMFNLTSPVQYGPIISLTNVTDIFSDQWFNVTKNLIFSSKHPAGNIMGGSIDTIELFRSNNSMYYGNNATLLNKGDLLSLISESRNQTYTFTDETYGTNKISLLSDYTTINFDTVDHPSIILDSSFFEFYSERS